MLGGGQTLQTLLAFSIAWLAFLTSHHHHIGPSLAFHIKDPNITTMIHHPLLQEKYTGVEMDHLWN